MGNAPVVGIYSEGGGVCGCTAAPWGSAECPLRPLRGDSVTSITDCCNTLLPDYIRVWEDLDFVLWMGNIINYMIYLPYYFQWQGHLVHTFFK